jgi:hypothetical protein
MLRWREHRLRVHGQRRSAAQAAIDHDMRHVAGIGEAEEPLDRQVGQIEIGGPARDGDEIGALAGLDRTEPV